MSETFDMPRESAGFEVRGAWLIQHLMADSRCGFTNIIHPAAIVGNLGGESRLTAIQEVNPIAGRGGFGWEQATGPRRVSFENFASQHGWQVTDDEANYEFLIWELCDDPNIKGDGSENRALNRLKQTTTLETAVYTFEVVFERPSSTSDVESRVKYAQRALAYLTKLPMPSLPKGNPPSPGISPSPIDPDSDEAAEELNKQELNRLGGIVDNQVKDNQTTLGVSTISQTTSDIKLAQTIPPARTSPGVAIIAGSGFTGVFAATIKYIGPWNWPLPAPSDGDALALAGFILTSGAAAFHLWANRKAKSNFNDVIGGENGT